MELNHSLSSSQLAYGVIEEENNICLILKYQNLFKTLKHQRKNIVLL